jgi:hypothetical protein
MKRFRRIWKAKLHVHTFYDVVNDRRRPEAGRASFNGMMAAAG